MRRQMTKQPGKQSAQRTVTRMVRLLIALPLLLGASLPGLAYGQVNVVTYHNDVARTGLNRSETILSPANVNSSGFGLLLSRSVEGVVVGQPLYLSSVS